ncbi:MAG: PQQ-dependent sugar dehydrogenase [Verrucomicrobiia bacterium]
MILNRTNIAIVLCATALATSASARDIARVYADNCASCHGANLEGGAGESLIDGKWKYGSSDEDIAKIIRDGKEEEGMPPMKNALSESEIRAMVIYIREKETQAALKKSPPPKPAAEQVVKSEKHNFRIRTVCEGIATPWAIAFLPDEDNKMLVTELAGRLRIVDKNGNISAPVENTPKVRAEGQGGLMDVALHPGYRTNRWVYLSYSERGTNNLGNNVGLTVIVRGHIKDGKWTDEQTIFRASPEFYRPGGIHFGSRIVFDNNGHVFFSIGERGTMQHAQDITRPNGKVHRLFDDGRVPPDNPFVNVPNAIPSIWSYGHRNPQGLDFNPLTGELWETEHGPRGGDELNLIEKGKNYGWPIITYGMNYDGSPITHLTHKEGLEQPVFYWTPSIAVCGIGFYRGYRFPKWKNNLFVASLAKEELWRLEIEAHRVAHSEILFKGIGRIRSVVTAPDGNLYLAMNNPDRIIKLEVAD